ncbi:MAG: hypothetical protein BGO10_07725 [Chlamydia sp. 32-24]|nr:MAG: hypothetical protein BGO10_07725 [Chlamydia sp. 32-24]
MFNDDLFSLKPASFFQMSADCKHIEIGPSHPFPQISKQTKKRYLLPDTSGLCGEQKFADVYIAWNQEGIELLLEVSQPLEKVIYPDFSKGDSFEVMVDTRDVKTSGYNTKFCHHFVFLPEPIEGKQGMEITRFRQEDSHELCSPDDLLVQANLASKKYSLSVFIPTHCLHGFDPQNFGFIGFTYRVNRFQDLPQHFSAVSKDYQIEQQPSLWASLKLVK